MRPSIRKNLFLAGELAIIVVCAGVVFWIGWWLIRAVAAALEIFET